MFLKGSHSQRRKNQAALPKIRNKKSRKPKMVGWCSKHFCLFRDLWLFVFPRGFLRWICFGVRVSFRDTFKAAFQSQDQLLRLEQCCAQANKKGWGFVSGVTQQTHSSWFLQREGLLNMHIKKWYVWVYIWYLYRCQYTYLYMTYIVHICTPIKNVWRKNLRGHHRPASLFFGDGWDPEKKTRQPLQP